MLNRRNRKPKALKVCTIYVEGKARRLEKLECRE